MAVSVLFLYFVNKSRDQWILGFDNMINFKLIFS